MALGPISFMSAAFILFAFLLKAKADISVFNSSFCLYVSSNDTGGGWESSNIGSSGGWRSEGGNPDAMFILVGSDSVDTPTLRQLITNWPAASLYLEVQFRCVDSTSLFVPLYVSVNGDTVSNPLNNILARKLGDWCTTMVYIQSPGEPFYLTVQTNRGAGFELDNIQRKAPKIDEVLILPTNTYISSPQRKSESAHFHLLNGRRLNKNGNAPMLLIRTFQTDIIKVNRIE